MPWEYAVLKDLPEPLKFCPNHTQPFRFRSFMRGEVHNTWRKWLHRWIRPTPYVCVICEVCKEIVGYEQADRRRQ